MLRQDLAELELLAKDLLIHVTSFFRDPKSFELLAKEVIPDLVHRHPSDRPLRIWVAGCSKRRGDLFPRHAFARGNRGGEAEY